MNAATTAPARDPTPPGRGTAVVDWLKKQYALYILIALLIIAMIASPAFLTGTNLTNLCCRCRSSASSCWPS